MKGESMQPGRKLEGKRVFSILGAVVAAMMLATPAPVSADDVSDAMWASVDQLVKAAVAAGGGDSANAISDLNTAEDLLNQAKAALSSDQAKFGKKIDAANKKLAKLDSQLESLSEKSAVSKLSSAAKSLQKLANYAGAPLLEEVTPNNSAGFVKAGTQVTMAFAIPASCGTDWTVTCTPPASDSGVIASYTPDYTTGTILITMGPAQGGADVSIHGCSCGAVECCSRELYNYGGKPSRSGSLITTFVGKFSGSTTGTFGACNWQHTVSGSGTITVSGDGTAGNPFVGTFAASGVDVITVLPGSIAECKGSTQHANFSGPALITNNGSNVTVNITNPDGSTAQFDGTIAGTTITGTLTLDSPVFDSPIVGPLTVKKK